MNYSKNLRKAAIAKRVITSWVIVAIVSILIGGASGYVLGSHITVKADAKTEEPALKCEVYNDYIITQELPVDWSNNETKFIPIDCDLDEKTQEFVFYLCEGYDIDWTLIMAIMQKESSFRKDVISSTNDYGLMQINQANHEWLTETLGVTDFLDSEQNIKSGVFVLNELFEKYTDTNRVLMAYNMGENGAKRLWDRGIYETNYTKSIRIIQQQFNEQLEGDTDAGILESN